VSSYQRKDKPRVAGHAATAMPITRKNMLGILGLAVIALFWVALNGILGGAIVAALIVLVVLVLNSEQRRKRRPPKASVDGSDESR